MHARQLADPDVTILRTFLVTSFDEKKRYIYMLSKHVEKVAALAAK